MTRFLLDEMLGPRLAAQLRRLGHDVEAIVEVAELRALPDSEVLARAASSERILVTANVGDFAGLDREWTVAGRRHHGIVFVTASAHPPRKGQLGGIVKALRRVTKSGQLPGPGQVSYLERAGPPPPRARR